MKEFDKIDSIVGDFTEFNGNTFICDDPVALAKAIEQYVIKAREQAYWDGVSDNENGYARKKDKKTELKKGLE